MLAQAIFDGNPRELLKMAAAGMKNINHHNDLSRACFIR
jgi:hypothetical protein